MLYVKQCTNDFGKKLKLKENKLKRTTHGKTETGPFLPDRILHNTIKVIN